MEIQKKQFLYATILGILNFICGVIHFVFEFFLLSNTSIYREFLLIENILIAFMFFYFFYVLIWGVKMQKVFFAEMSIYFWIIFVFTVLCFQPEVTSLHMINWMLSIPQKYILIFTGIVAFILSWLNYRCIKTLEKNSQENSLRS